VKVATGIGQRLAEPGAELPVDRTDSAIGSAASTVRFGLRDLSNPEGFDGPRRVVADRTELGAELLLAQLGQMVHRFSLEPFSGDC